MDSAVLRCWYDETQERLAGCWVGAGSGLQGAYQNDGGARPAGAGRKCSLKADF